MVIIIACLFLVIRDGSGVWDGGMCVFGLMMIRSSRGVFSLIRQSDDDDDDDDDDATMTMTTMTMRRYD